MQSKAHAMKMDGMAVWRAVSDVENVTLAQFEFGQRRKRIF